MEDSQRQAMYDGWARGKKWVEVTVEKKWKDSTFNGIFWVASCEIGEQNFTHYEFGDSKAQAIQRMELWLLPKGYEISNLPELMGIVEEKRTFLEWCKEVDLKVKTKDGVWFEFKNEIPQHKLKY